jgi:general secretion pathway protein D
VHSTVSTVLYGTWSVKGVSLRVWHHHERGARALRAAALALVTVATCAATAATPQRHARVDLLAHNEPVQSVLLRLAHDTGASIAVAPGVTGYVTLSLHGVTLPQALAAILSPLGDSYRMRGKVYDVEPGPAPAAGAAALGAAIAPAVLAVTIVPVHRAAAQLRALFPQASVREDARSNALLVLAPPADLQAMRTVLQGIDVRNPTDATTEAIGLRTVRADTVTPQLHASFPRARIAAVGTKQLLVTALPQDLAQIRAALNALDAPTATPPPVALGSEAVRVTQRRPADIARALSRQVAGLHAAVSGGAVVLAGPPDAVARAKALVAQLDVPAFDARYTQVYRIKSLDAGSVADLLRRSFRDVEVTVDTAINALAVTATAAQQQRIADAVAQLDPAPSAGGLPGTASFGPGSSTELVTLKSAVPGQTNGGPDAVTAITQALQAIAPDVRVVQLPTPAQIALIGSPTSVRVARDFIDKIDVIAPQVVLDTEVLELDESTAKNLGIQLGTAVLSTTYTEATPAPDSNGAYPRLGRLQGFSRTPLSFTAQLNLAVSNGHGRVLADPRITTLSGRTASIRAGDTLSILTTTSGNAGTIATTQVQSFQTGVTLDITPLVDSVGGVTVALHPVVNSLVGVSSSGVPEISTRDTQTTVHLQNNETLVIGGLIQENETRTTTKIPGLGDLPLVGRVFRNDNVTSSRNELIIVVTPHIVTPGAAVLPGPPLGTIPTPQPLPTLPPNATLPAPLGQFPRSQQVPAARNRSNAAPGTLAAPPLTGGPQPASPLAPSTAPASPMPTGTTPAPAPTAFAQTNVFTFGSAPQSNFAKTGDPVQIFYATLSPTLVTNGTPIKLAAITTTNASAVKLLIGNQTFGLAHTGPGQWQSAFAFPLAAVPVGQTSVNLALIATRPDGTASTVTIPVNVTPAN